jgi:site-specific DNA recombinase
MTNKIENITLTLTEQKKEKAVIVVRVSTDREDQKTSVQNQIELGKELIEERGWELYKIYKDIVSGRIKNRPDYNNMLKEMENGDFQYVVAKEFSRLTRSLIGSEKLREISTKNNVHLLSVDGELDTLKKGYECITQLAADAQKEAEKTSKRTKNAIRMQAKRGEFIGSIPPYGYYVENKKLYPRDDETVQTVKRIFRSYLNGKGAKTIAKELQAEGFPTPSMIVEKSNATANWNDTTIYGILKNEAYIGNLVQLVEETYFANEERKRKKKPKNSVIKVEKTHEPIIKREIFEGVQNLRVSKPKSGAKGQEHIFSNILFCKDCGSRLIFKSNWGKGSYVCSKYAKKGATHCSNHAINENQLMTKLSNELNNINKLNFDIFTQKAARKLRQAVRNLEGKLSAAQSNIRKIENRMDTIEDELLDFPSKEKETRLLKSLERQQNELVVEQAKITKFQEKINYLKAPETTTKVRTKLMNVFQFNNFNLMTVNLFISKIDVNEDKTLEIHYRFNETNAS